MHIPPWLYSGKAVCYNLQLPATGAMIVIWLMRCSSRSNRERLTDFSAFLLLPTSHCLQVHHYTVTLTRWSHISLPGRQVKAVPSKRNQQCCLLAMPTHGAYILLQRCMEANVNVNTPTV